MVVSGKPQRRDRERVVHHPVGLRRVHVLAVGVGRRQQRAEEAVERRERRRDLRDERQVVPLVVADREDVVVARPQEAVHLAVVELRPPAAPRVVGVRVRAALEVAVEPVRGERPAGAVHVRQPGLHAVGARQPPEVVVEGAVLHHQHDERVDREVARRGQRGGAALGGGRLADEPVRVQQHRRAGAEARERRGALEELAAAQVAVGVLGGQALGLARVTQVGHATASYPGKPVVR